MKTDIYTCGHCKEFKGDVSVLMEHFEECEKNPHFLHSYQHQDLITHVLQKVKEMMDLRMKAYEANHEFAKATAIKLMCYDIISGINFTWSTEFNETIPTEAKEKPDKV